MFQHDSDSRPRLEFYAPESSQRKTAYIDHTPFTIGRCEGVDLPLPSTSVSREHAQILRSGTGFRLKDLGSTNGTEVNGQPIDEAVIMDGDAIRVADVNITFCSSSMGRLQRIVTQPMRNASRSVNSSTLDAASLAARSLQEAVLWQSVPLRWTTTPQRDNVTVAIDQPLAALMKTPHDSEHSRPRIRLQSIAWRLAAERVAASNWNGTVLARIENVHCVDSTVIDDLADSMTELPLACRWGALLPWNPASANSHLHQLANELTTQGILYAIKGFSGAASGIDTLRSARPQFLVLSTTFVEGVLSHPRRGQQLSDVQLACESLDIPLYLPSRLSIAATQACGALGLDQLMSEGFVVDAFRDAAPQRLAPVPSC